MSEIPPEDENFTHCNMPAPFEVYGFSTRSPRLTYGRRTVDNAVVWEVSSTPCPHPKSLSLRARDFQHMVLMEQHEIS
jgi:hypothetical protein